MAGTPLTTDDNLGRTEKEVEIAPTLEDGPEAAVEDTDAPRPVKLNRQQRIELAHALGNASEVEIVGARTEGRTGMRFTLSIDGEELALAASSITVLEGDLGAITSKPKNLKRRYNRVKRPEDLSVEELKERNLPLYWNEKWLRSELERVGSYAEIARTHGYPSGITIAAYAKRKFGISVQKTYDQKRQAVYRDHDTGKYTHLELANKYNVGVATVYRWLKERDGE